MSVAQGQSFACFWKQKHKEAGIREKGIDQNNIKKNDPKTYEWNINIVHHSQVLSPVQNWENWGSEKKYDLYTTIHR